MLQEVWHATARLYQDLSIWMDHPHGAPAERRACSVLPSETTGLELYMKPALRGLEGGIALACSGCRWPWLIQSQTLLSICLLSHQLMTAGLGLDSTTGQSKKQCLYVLSRAQACVPSSTVLEHIVTLAFHQALYISASLGHASKSNNSVTTSGITQQCNARDAGHGRSGVRRGL